MFSHGNHPNKRCIPSDHIVLHATSFVRFSSACHRKINTKHLSGRICATICGDFLLSNFIFIKLPDIKNEGGDLHWPLNCAYTIPPTRSCILFAL
jgi:hypothetical protein